MQSTRQKILTLLEKNHSASSVEISRALGMTSANVRHHLTALEKNGLVEVAGQQANTGRGRPTLLYMATSQAQTNNLATLASVLIKELVVKQKRNLGKRLQRIAKMLSDGVEKGSSITQRLYASTRHLNTMNYNSHWEAHAEGPHVIFGQCPYAAIIEEHPELCTMDAYTLENMLGTEVEQAAKIERKPGGQAHCVFIVRNSS